MPDSEAPHAWLMKCGIPHEYEMLLDVAHDSAAHYERAGLAGFLFQAESFKRAQ